MIQNSRYFFYGSPANYALVGQEDQRIWLVTDDLNAAQYISQTFSSKITLVVFDLTTFENYTPSLVDNSICFNWQVPVNVLNATSVLNTSTDKINSIIYTGENLQLQNIIDHDILLLSADRCQELQQQLMCIHNIYKSFELTNSVIADKVGKIIAVNLELYQIEKELYNLANTEMIVHNNTSASMLTALGRFYE